MPCTTTGRGKQSGLITDSNIPESARIFTEHVHVEDVAVLDALDDANRNVDERVFMKYKQPVVGQRNDAIGARPAEVFHALTVQLLERYSESFLVALDRLFGVHFADKDGLQCVLVGSNAAAITTASHYTATAVYLKTHNIITISLIHTLVAQT